MDYWFIDYETYYSREYSLRRMTVPEYILSPQFECMGAAVKKDEAPAEWVDASKLPDFFASLDPNKTMLISHNALFDACITAWIYGFHPKLTGDTLGIARATLGHELKSLSLSSVARHLGLGFKGDAIIKVEGMGSAAIKQAGLWEQYTDYAKNDAELCAGIWRELVFNRKFPAKELVLMDRITRCATQPKFQIDQQALCEHLALVKAKKEALMQRIGFSREDLMSNDKFAAALTTLGVTPPRKVSLATGNQTWAFAKNDPQFIELEEHEDPEVQALVAARLGVKTTLEETRTQRFIDLSNLHWSEGDRWMPIPLRYGGAHTHRLSGEWKMNLQNLPRGGALRKALVAPPGYKVIAPDSSQIEARINAWLGDEAELLQGFREGRDIYSEFASDVFGYPVSKQMKKERFLGKTCLAEGTLIFTDKGLVPIEQVTTAHKLWDGEEWVCHQGLLYKGWKKTLQLCGLWLTPDHQVWCGAQWKAAELLARDKSILHQALATAAGGSPSLVTCGVTEAGSTPSSSGAIAGGLNTPSRVIISKLSKACAAARAATKKATESIFGATSTRCLMSSTAPGCLTASPQQLHVATVSNAGFSITTAGEGLAFAGNGGLTARPSLGMSKAYRAGITRILKWIASTSTATTSPATFGLSRALKTLATNARLQTLRPASASLRRNCKVYDLVNAGPRHRFTVMTDAGPMIVSNCILGLGYGMGWAKFQAAVKVQSRLQLKEEIILDDAEAQRIVQMYRTKYSGIARNWALLNSAGITALNTNGGFELGPCVFGDRKITLPSLLHLHYHDLKFDTEKREWIYTYGGVPKRVYGPKLLENIVQALARIVVMDAALAIEKRFEAEFDNPPGLALQVHDELVYVVPDEIVDRAVVICDEEMRNPPTWAKNLPLASECDVGQSYGDAK